MGVVGPVVATLGIRSQTTSATNPRHLIVVFREGLCLLA
jgi:hypothetical protein